MMPKDCLRRSGFAFRADDKVMQVKNNYEKEVFNGDIGIIASVHAEDRTLKVNFDGRIVEYDVTELDELVHAYATTIHKAQGSEYPIVVMPVLMNHYVMLQRNLIYTGITRAKKILVIVGTRKALSYAVRNVTVTKRNTLLKERLALEADLPVVSSAGQMDEIAENQKNHPLHASEDTAMKYHQEAQKPSHEEWLRTDLFDRIAQSEFRSRFRLKAGDKAYVSEKGMEKIEEHARDFIRKRLAPADIPNDGKQTPMRGCTKSGGLRLCTDRSGSGDHPVFLAQHACACCCRGCLEKWHGIPQGIPLDEKQQDYATGVLMKWINRQMKE
jgi:exodeoxyribonuclease V alpha subunit